MTLARHPLSLPIGHLYLSSRHQPLVIGWPAQDSSVPVAIFPGRCDKRGLVRGSVWPRQPDPAMVKHPADQDRRYPSGRGLLR
jgi:hypothetical protein